MTTLAIQSHLRWAFAGFCVAASGVGVGFLSQPLHSHVAGVVGYSITVAGVAIGFVAVILGFARTVSLFLSRRREPPSKVGPAA